MELTLLLIIPLVSGYNFAKGWKKSAYQLVRESDQSIYFKSAYYGIILAILSLVFYYLILIATNEHYPNLLQSPPEPVRSVGSIFLSFFPKEPHISAVLVYALTLCISIVLYSILNFRFIGYINFLLKMKLYFKKWLFIFKLLINKNDIGLEEDKLLNEKQDELNHLVERHMDKTLRKIRKAIKINDFECMLIDSMLKTLPISITLQSKKTYIGFVTDTPNPEIERKYLKLLPLVSGYRRDDFSLELTTDYVEYYSGDHFNTNDTIELEDFHIILKAESISSMNLFDFDTYYQLQESSKKHR